MPAAPVEERVAALLEEAAETHHRVYRITEGTDEDWASWYATWLLELSELPDALGATAGAKPISFTPSPNVTTTTPRLHRMSRGRPSMHGT
jgi:hypothetical protein